jgi:hypothetical protein
MKIPMIMKKMIINGEKIPPTTFLRLLNVSTGSSEISVPVVLKNGAWIIPGGDGGLIGGSIHEPSFTVAVLS